MKAILEFDLDDEHEKWRFDLCNQVEDMYFLIWEFDQRLRSMYKYEDKSFAYDIRQLLREYLDEKNIKL
jgi:hypothetical protein